MVYEYIQLHEGKVSLESEEGKGARFIVDIPADLKREVQQEASEENRIASPVMADVGVGAVGEGDDGKGRNRRSHDGRGRDPRHHSK